VLRVLDPPSADDRARFAAFGREHGIDVYLQPGGPGSIQPLGEPARLAYTLPEFDVELEFAPTDFIQINGEVNRRMVSAAVELADVRPGERVLDLFSGLGNFTLPSRATPGSSQAAARTRAATAFGTRASSPRISPIPTGRSIASAGTSPCSIRRALAPRSRCGSSAARSRGGSSMYRVIQPRSRAMRESSLPSTATSCGRCGHWICSRTRIMSRRWRCSRSEEHTSELQSRENLVCRL